MREIIVVALASVLCACNGSAMDVNPPKIMVDQVARRAIFTECLKNLPAGPRATQYNDWDEVVDACSNAAYYQAQICVADCGGTVYGAPSDTERAK